MSRIEDVKDSLAIQGLQKVLKKIEDAYSPNTLRAYRADFLEFIQFCEVRGLPSIPANYESVALFVDANVDRGCSINFIKRKISELHLFINSLAYLTQYWILMFS